LFTGARVPHQIGQKEQPASYQDAINAVLLVSKSVAAELSIRQATRSGFHPGRCAEFLDENQNVVAVAGELDPALAVENDLPRRVAAAEINLTALYSAAPNSISSSAILVMPAATQYLSLVVDRNVSAFDVLAAIAEGAGELLENVSLTDDYRGDNVAADKKSLTFALLFRASARTLTQAEASVARDAAVAQAASKYGAEIRA
jgi:phenylalanyl-tRNA synthetase beta chain